MQVWRGTSAEIVRSGTEVRRRRGLFAHAREADHPLARSRRAVAVDGLLWAACGVSGRAAPAGNGWRCCGQVVRHLRKRGGGYRWLLWWLG